MRRGFVTGVLLAALGGTASAHFVEGQVYIVDASLNRVYFIDTDKANWTWNVSLDATDGLVAPSTIRFNGEGLLWVGDPGVNGVWEFQPNLRGAVALDSMDGITAPGGSNGITVDNYLWSYVLNQADKQILKVSPNLRHRWVFADSSDGLTDPHSMVFLSDGTMLVADGASGNLIQIDRTGVATTFDNIPGEDLRSLAVDDNRKIFVACDSGAIYEYPQGLAANRKFFVATGGAGPSMQFDQDFRFLIHVNQGDKKVRSINANTGVINVEIDAGASWGDPVSLAVMGSQNPPGTFTPYGTWTAGTGRYNPEIHGTGDIRPGGGAIMEVHSLLGGAKGLLLTGIAPSELPFAGGTLAIDLTQWHFWQFIMAGGRPGNPGEGEVIMSMSIPPDPALTLAKFYFQAFAADPLAVQGISITHGAMFWIGE